jgi:hypothetical protein
MRSFLVEILRSEFNSFHAGQLESELIVNDRYKMVHNITSGRPLFVYQFAYIWMQSGTIDSALARDIKQEKQAIDFLYGRIYDYLSTISKDIFVAIGQIVADDDLTNLIDKVRYILNLEENDCVLLRFLRVNFSGCTQKRFYKQCRHTFPGVMTASAEVLYHGYNR